MNNSVYIVSLAGKHVFHDWSIQCAIKSMSDLDKVRAMIKEKDLIEFEQFSSSFTSYYWKFNNISDNRDIYLIVERVNML